MRATSRIRRDICLWLPLMTKSATATLWKSFGAKTQSPRNLRSTVTINKCAFVRPYSPLRTKSTHARLTAGSRTLKADEVPLATPKKLSPYTPHLSRSQRLARCETQCEYSTNPPSTMFVPLAGSGDSILSTQVRPTFRAFAPVTRDRSVCGLHGQSAVAPSIWLARARLWSEVCSTLVHCRCTRTCQNHLREMRPPDSYPPPLVLLYFHMETSRGRW